MKLRDRLNPRLHLAAAIGWAVFGVVCLAALITANLAAAQAEARARADAEGQLAEFATQVRDALAMHLETRRSLLQATAAQIVADRDQSPQAMRATLQATQARFPEFVWLGVSDNNGLMLADSGDGLTLAHASALSWLRQGREQRFVSDPHALPEADRLAGGLKVTRVMDAAVPMDPRHPTDSGVLAAQLSWHWLQDLLGHMQQALDASRQLDVLVVGRDGRVLLGPDAWLGRSLEPDNDASEGGLYLTGRRTRLRLAEYLGLGWTAVVRQRADIALAPVRNTRRTVFITVLLAGVLSALAAALVTRWLMQRLGSLAREAEAVRQGRQASLAVPAGADEISRIGATLSQLVNHLQLEKQSLQTLNRELDQRVAERTQRIEQLADEARRTAVVRERLRIARDLHDTLAHSLMALLTQVRLVRKLRDRLAPDELDAELARAEDVAASGLAGARQAIGQMRRGGARDNGLGPALQDLAQRFAERTGLSPALNLDPAGAPCAGEVGEAVCRIAEEALRNVERHARASQLTVSLSAAPAPLDQPRPVQTGQSLLRLEIIDDGCGFVPAEPPPGHYGLQGMQEQAHLIGARCEVISAPHQGTCVRVDFAA